MTVLVDVFVLVVVIGISTSAVDVLVLVHVLVDMVGGFDRPFSS